MRAASSRPSTRGGQSVGRSGSSLRTVSPRSGKTATPRLDTRGQGRSSSRGTSRGASTFRTSSVKGRPTASKSPRLSSSARAGINAGPSGMDAYAPRGGAGNTSGQGAPSFRSIGGARGQAPAGSGNRPSQRGSTPLRSVSVSQVRGQAKSSGSRFHLPWKGIAIVLVVLAVLAGVVGVVLSNTNLFPVEEVTVSGVTHLTAEELTDLAAVPEGSTLLNIDADGISSRLSSNAWVQSVTVDRVFPNTINLNVTERSISAVVEVTVDNSNHTQTWALASDGMWLMEIPDQDSEEAQGIASAVYEDAANVLHITDIPYGSAPEAGTYCSNANIENALGIIDGMTTELKDQVASVSAFSSDSTTLTLQSGVEIAFGDSNNIRDKELVCLQLLEEHPNQISYINVRSVNNPVWRSL